MEPIDFHATFLKLEQLWDADDPDADTIAHLSAQLARQAETPAERDLADLLERVRQANQANVARADADSTAELEDVYREDVYDDYYLQFRRWEMEDAHRLAVHFSSAAAANALARIASLAEHIERVTPERDYAVAVADALRDHKGRLNRELADVLRKLADALAALAVER
jgi:hypothetical protein